MLDAIAKNLPRGLIDNVIGVCGANGERWLCGLPSLIAEIESKWNIRVSPHFADLSYNFVAPATRYNGSPVVLKLGLPSEDPEIHCEADYLRHLDGRGAVKLLDEDRELRALLLEHVQPGLNLRKAFNDQPSSAVRQSIRLLKVLMTKLPAHQNFVTLESWTEKLINTQHYEFPRLAADLALSVFESSGDGYLLHGDFHHMNILEGPTKSFVAIDPKGIVGDLKYDIAVFLNNHYSWLRGSPNVRELLDSAVMDFAEAFGFSTEEIRRWAYAQKVLAAYWTMTEKGSRWRLQLASADIWNV